MDKPEIKAFLQALSARSVEVHTQWVQASCPLAPWTHSSGRDAHPSFAIKIEPAKESTYNCFSCGGGDLMDLVQKLARHGAELPRYDLKTAVELASADGDRPLAFRVKDWGATVEDAEPYVTFPEPWLDSFVSALAVPRALKYLKGRRVYESVISALDLRYDHERDAVCFPVRDFDGQLCGLRGRHLRPGEGPPYHMYGDADGHRNNQVWLGEAWIDFDKPLVMCESVFDLAAIYPHYHNVCAPLTVSFKRRKARRMRQAVDIITVFDADKGGDKGRERISRYLGRANITHVMLPEGTDPGALPSTELREYLSPFVKLRRRHAATTE